MASAPARPRVLDLEGSRNLRDLGGYPTEDGRSVRWGVVYRSGSLAGLSQAAWDTLVAGGLRSICDLRTTRERALEPFGWADAEGLNYFARDYDTSAGELRRVMLSGHATAGEAHAAMIESYLRLPFEQAPAYRRLFEHLRDGEVPVVFNCSAGKDRAGTAAALVLSALGVPRETVVADFLLTNEAVDLRASILGRASSESVLARQAPEVADAIMTAHPDYIRAGLGAIEARHGSVAGYCDAVLGIGAGDLATIRDALLD